MDFDLDLGEWIIIGLSAFLFAWYFLAGVLNRKRGTATYRWLHRALETMGEISSAEWIGASNMGARLTVKRAKKPFRRVEAHYLLEPREFLPYWLISRLQGKRDEVLIRVVLRAAPRGSLEIARSRGRNRADQGATSSQIEPGFELLHSDVESARLLEGINGFLAENGKTVKSLTIQRDSPHLEIYADIKSLPDFPTESYFKILLAIFQDA